MDNIDLLNNVNIWDKEIILYGDEKIRNDIEYLFKSRGLNIRSCDINDDVCFIETNRSDRLIVLCRKAKDETFEVHAKELGMKQGEHYLYAKDFFLYYDPIFLERKNKKLAVWGTGACANELWEILNQRGLASEIAFYIDNAEGKNMFRGKQVLNPMEIKNRCDIYIIVATREFQWDIYQQLNEYGFQRKKDYVHYNVIARDYGKLLEKACFTEEQYPYFCHRPFGYCDVIGDHLYLCCPDFLPISAGSMQFEPFMDCWNSYIAHILRLSIVNGSFAFCNKQYCDLFDFHKITSTREELKANYEKSPLEHPNTLMVGIDHSCNLRCPSCRKEVYVAAADERKELDRRAEDLLENVLPYVNRLWLAGSGEVFFSKTYRKILADRRCKQRSSISILSNGVLFDEDNWKLLEDACYESIEVAVSMDGMKNETIEKLRRGASAQKLKRNLEFLGRLRKQGKIQRLFLSCVVQADNIAELQELLNYCQDIGVDKIQFLKLKDNGAYADNDDQFDEVSVFDDEGRIKKRFKPYFTEELLFHSLADWFNSSDVLQAEKKPRLDIYDTF